MSWIKKSIVNKRYLGVHIRTLDSLHKIFYYSMMSKGFDMPTEPKKENKEYNMDFLIEVHSDEDLKNIKDRVHYAFEALRRQHNDNFSEIKYFKSI